MKISKSLLSAILVGVTLGTVTSCEKAPLETLILSAENGNPTKEGDTCKTPKDDLENTTTNHNYDNCPACGMG